mmetsp:Transcript_82118/g.238094  ORF Transcript_82118/g.238094 Transcript_82118/m.238094 type:complete len:279 (-) Transcript_82118:418-1254(-)
MRVVADLNEGHITREDTLLGRLPLHIQALADSGPTEHFRDRGSACRTVDGEPLGRTELRRVGGLTLPIERSPRSTAVAVCIEVRDQLARVRQILLRLEVCHRPEQALELSSCQHEDLAPRYCLDIGGARGIRHQRDLAEELTAAVAHVLLDVAPGHLVNHRLAEFEDEELLATFVALLDDVLIRLVCTDLKNIGKTGDLLILHHLQQFRCAEVVLPPLPLLQLQPDAQIHEVLPPQLPTDTLGALCLQSVWPEHAVEDLTLVDDIAWLLDPHRLVPLS